VSDDLSQPEVCRFRLELAITAQVAGRPDAVLLIAELRDNATKSRCDVPDAPGCWGRAWRPTVNESLAWHLELAAGLC
jgi:hypothetical protein